MTLSLTQLSKKKKERYLYKKWINYGNERHQINVISLSIYVLNASRSTHVYLKLVAVIERRATPRINWFYPTCWSRPVIQVCLSNSMAGLSRFPSMEN